MGTGAKHRHQQPLDRLGGWPPWCGKPSPHIAEITEVVIINASFFCFRGAPPAKNLQSCHLPWHGFPTAFNEWPHAQAGLGGDPSRHHGGPAEAASAPPGPGQHRHHPSKLSRVRTYKGVVKPL